MLTFTVTLLYGGSKARLTSEPLELVVAVVKDDLTTLRMVQPGSDTFQVTGPGQVKFSWTVHQSSNLHKLLEAKINPHSPSSILKLEPELLCGLSIIGIEYFVQEDVQYRQEDMHLIIESFSSSGDSDSPSLKPYTPDHDVQVINALVPLSDNLEERANEKEVLENRSHQTMQSDRDALLEFTLPELRQNSSSHTADTSSAVPLLDDVFKVRQRSASANLSFVPWRSWPFEAVFPSFPLEAILRTCILTHRLQAATQILPGKPLSERELDMNHGTAKTETGLFKKVKRPRSLSPDCWDSDPYQASFGSFEGNLSLTEANANDFASNAIIVRSTGDSGVEKIHSRPSDEIVLHQDHSSSHCIEAKNPFESFQQAADHTTTISIPKLIAKPRNAKPRPKAPQRHSKTEHQSNAPISNPSDNSVINKLSLELVMLRKELRSGAERQRSILKELRDIGAPDATLKPMLAVVDSRIEAESDMLAEPNAMEAIEAHLHAIENEIKIEQERRSSVIRELRKIETEEREPFVVPALLDAFISLSKLTTDANERLKRDAALTLSSGQDG
ncbi:hypothetical protein GYMLUDRAFT_623989 [Collybiopsis luxurians FD-317 M1]|nr:hypothetical protein GYMLUDRAFT_623989 [Collybiopsis luxurians FD-317 M1]